MANLKVSDLTAQTTPHNADLMMIVDSTDTSQSANGSTKKITVQNLQQNLAPLTHTHVESDVTNLTTDLASKESTANKGIASGYAGLDTNATVPTTQLPTVPISKGGTGQVTQQTAIDALLPTQTSNSGKYLTTNGTTSSWGAVVGGGQSPYTKIVAASGGDYTTLGAAISAVASGTTIYVMPGTYTESALTATKDSIRVIGANPESTIINIASNAWSLSASTVYGFHFEGLQFKIQNATLNFNCPNSIITNCHFRVTGASGWIKLAGHRILFQGNYIYTSATPTANDTVGMSGVGVRVDDNHFYFDGGSAGTFGLVGAVQASSLISGNLFWFNGSGGPLPLVRIANNNANVVGNTFFDNVGQAGQWGVDDQGLGTNITGNAFNSLAGGAVICTGSSGTISGNSVYGCAVGFVIKSSFHTITGNYLQNASAVAIGIDLQASVSRCIVSANTIRAFTTGINVSASSCVNNLLSANIVNGCTTAINDLGTTTTNANNITT